MDHLGYAQNLVLTFAVAALGYWFSLLRDREFVPGSSAKCGMLLSLISLSMSALSGIACVLTRLYDFRGTARRARGRQDAPSKGVLGLIGRATLTLFHVQYGAFIVGIAAIAVALLLTYGGKLT